MKNKPSNRGGHGKTNSTKHGQEVLIDLGSVKLRGTLTGPDPSRGVVVFVQGSGSGRLNPRNILVAHTLQKFCFATLLFDLLTEQEVDDPHRDVDTSRMAERLDSVKEWVLRELGPDTIPVGYFGFGTGAAVALLAAAIFPEGVKAVVSRGGRPDLVAPHLSQVTVPTLLIVGGRDDLVLKLNRNAYTRLLCPKDFLIVPGASHHFEEPGAWEDVAQWSAQWFSKHLVRDLELV